MVERAGGQGAVIGAPNYAEAMAVLEDAGQEPAAVDRRLAGAVEVRPFDHADALAAAELRAATRPSGLSLGDRVCLALGLRLALPVLTADRAWARLDVGVDVVVIRS